MATACCGGAALLATTAESSEAMTEKRHPNVLFIAVDDLRPEFGCLGVKNIITPNIDKLAASGIIFSKQYVQVPTCGASRYCLLTGLYPRSKSALNNHAAERGDTALSPGFSKKARSMPELFRKNGYRTICIGKISHMPDGKVFNYNGTGDGHPELPDAWDKFATPYGSWKYGHGAFFAYAKGRHREDGSGYKPLWEFPEVKDSDLPDGMNADAAIKELKELKKSKKPFFLGLGFFKPHLPFVAPKKYRNMYNNVSIPSPYGMKVGDTKCWTRSGEFFKYKKSFKRNEERKPLSEGDAENARRAYYACVTYVDAQIGRVINELKQTGLDKNTIIVLWGDHGWQLGEHNIWGKHTALDKALRSPLIIVDPSIKRKGVNSEALVAKIDIYPTLIDLCGLQNRETAKPIDGKSIRPLLENQKASIRKLVVSFWGPRTTITDGTYRLIISKQKKNSHYFYELYDHKTDPGELKNIAQQNPERVNEMMQILKKEYPQILINANTTKHN